MATETKCPHCRKPVPTTALDGICPECMLQAGVAETGEIGLDGTAVAKPQLSIPRIEDIAPHFPQLEILECLGRGGMGAVYKARQPKLDRLVALKILTRSRDTGITDTEFAARFQQEARALARLSHPDIVAVYDFGEAGGFHYLLMEFVDGLTLRQLLQTRRLAPEEALAIVPKICGALQFAHERGIVHRDIKPENILLDKRGQLKIADFGIAKILGSDMAAQALTGVKDRLGTPHYMAPEQIEKPATVDHRADIFSLGVVFYEMLTGELPLGKFQSPSKKVQVDVRLDEVVLHALEKEPERRYQHASEVKTDVETIAASPGQSPPKHAEWERRAPGWRIRCLKCGFTEHWGKYGIRLGAAGTKYTLGRCPRCQRYRIHVVEKGLVQDSGSHTHAPTAKSEGGPIPTNARWITAARWTARIFSVLLFAFYGIFILAEGLPPIASQPEGVQLNFVALGLMLAGFAVGWKREGTAALLIAAGWTLWQISENAIRWNLFQTPLPVAMLYGFCWWSTRGRRTGTVAMAVLMFALALGLGRVFVPTNIFVRGVVRDAQNGQPVPNAELRLPPRSTHAIETPERPNARTGPDGRFTLYVGWLSDQTPVTISAPGYETLTTSFGPRPPQRNMLRDFHLQAAGAIPVELKVPPVVVETFPASGASGVDSGLTELRVTFSKPMRDGGWSWVKVGDETFPAMTTAPRYLPDNRTCVLPVKLGPGKLYAVWVNHGDAMNFKDADGNAALPYLLIFETRK